MNEIKNRDQVLEVLKQLHGYGYRYVVRDEMSEYLSCFSLKPKKYREIGWGYVNSNEPGVKMAYPIRNTDITEINSTNRSAVLIEDLIDNSK